MTSSGAPAPAMGLIPPKPKPEETATSTVRLAKAMIAKLDEIAAALGYSRNEVIVLFLQWAITEHEKDDGSPPPTARRRT